ncbi:MAG: hypothetical protein J5802_03100 [Butyrivibrio sp.]|nr:hypothetical protein [Butyrivibrio sp.]
MDKDTELLKAMDAALYEMVTAAKNLATAANELKKSIADDEKKAVKKAPTKKTKEAKEAAPSITEEVKPEPTEKTYTFQEVRGVMATLAGNGKKAEAKALLTEFGVNRLSEVKEEDFPALVKRAEEMLNA